MIRQNAQALKIAYCKGFGVKQKPPIDKKSFINRGICSGGEHNLNSNTPQSGFVCVNMMMFMCCGFHKLILCYPFLVCATDASCPGNCDTILFCRNLLDNAKENAA